ncbi:MAG: cytochrome c [Proteobacteria bacterium]|nr:cytochrome c [Pseudomonadota bacterium]
MTLPGSVRALRSLLATVPACVALLGVAPRGHADEPQTDYMLNCMGCHVQDGSGAQGKVPSLRDTLVPFAQTADGRRYLVQVPGTAQSVLSDAEIAALLNWMMRQLSGVPLPAGVADFTAQEVGSYRAQRLEDPAAMRAQLLLKAAHP